MRSLEMFDNELHNHRHHLFPSVWPGSSGRRSLQDRGRGGGGRGRVSVDGQGGDLSWRRRHGVRGSHRHHHARRHSESLRRQRIVRILMMMMIMISTICGESFIFCMHGNEYACSGAAS